MDTAEKNREVFLSDMLMFMNLLQTEFLSGEIKKRDAIIDKLEKEGGITNRRSSSTWHDRAVLKDIMSNLDTIGFDQTKVIFMYVSQTIVTI